MPEIFLKISLRLDEIGWGGSLPAGRQGFEAGSELISD
jgi:hypothetical protein